MNTFVGYKPTAGQTGRAQELQIIFAEYAKKTVPQVVKATLLATVKKEDAVLAGHMENLNKEAFIQRLETAEKYQCGPADFSASAIAYAEAYVTANHMLTDMISGDQVIGIKTSTRRFQRPEPTEVVIANKVADAKSKSPIDKSTHTTFRFLSVEPKKFNPKEYFYIRKKVGVKASYFQKRFNLSQSAGSALYSTGFLKTYVDMFVREAITQAYNATTSVFSTVGVPCLISETYVDPTRPICNIDVLFGLSYAGYSDSALSVIDVFAKGLELIIPWDYAQTIGE